MDSEKNDALRENLNKWMQEADPQPDLTYNIEDDIGQESEALKPPKTSYLLRGLAVATVIVLATIGGYKWYQNQQATAVKTLVRTSFEALPRMENIYYLDSASQEPKTKLFVEGMGFYKQKNYSKTIESLDNQLLKRDDGAQFYLAMSYIYSQQNPIKTEQILRGLVDKNTIVKAEAQRYFALILLQNGKTAEAKIQLKSLENDVVFGAKAKEILTKLK